MTVIGGSRCRIVPETDPKKLPFTGRLVAARPLSRYVHRYSESTVVLGTTRLQLIERRKC